MLQAAVIASAHGVRGLVNVRCLLKNPDDLFRHPLADAQGRPFRLTLRGHKEKSLIAAVEGIADRDAAEALKGTALFIAAETQLAQRRGKSKKTFDYSLLIGAQVRLASGAAFGTVQSVHNFGAGDLLEIALPDDTTELFAFTEANFPHADAKTGALTIDPPEEI